MTQQDTHETKTPHHRSFFRPAIALVRNTWRKLTSMRTALVLLFLLALAAVPGALLPQRNLNVGKVNTYIAARGALGQWMDKIELFDVFSSSWFTAIYVLLFVSLIGCLIPRLAEHLRALRSTPVRAPRNLSRLPHHHAAQELNADSTAAVERVRAALPRWRLAVRTTDDGTTELSAEKGYLREAGNLLFHFSLLGLLVTIAIGKLLGYEGSVIVIADGGPGFCNTSPAVYDSFKTGNATDGTGLEPFCIRVNDFAADYLDNGQASMFTSNISYQEGATDDGQWNNYQLKVNSPLRIGGERVYLTGHGYAPQFTVTFPDGQTRTESLQFRPDDATTFLSSGALRFDPPGGTYGSAEERRTNQIAVEGLFAPTAAFNGNLLTSAFPDMRDPAVAIDIYKGDTGLDTGIPQSIFSLNTEMINQGRLTKQARVNLRPGESSILPDGTRVTFDGAKEFANLQVSHDPAQIWVLVFAVTMITGLITSLVIKRRRIWVRITSTASGPAPVSLIELGGLARTDHAGWGAEFDIVHRRIWQSEEPARREERHDDQ